MSSAVLSRLPRFDVEPDADALNRMGLRAGPEGDVPAVEETPAIEEPPVEPGPDLSEVTALVATLSQTIDRVEREAGQQVQATLQSMARELFPILGEKLLAEEIAATLKDVLPVSIAALELRVATPLAEPLREAMARSEALSARCSLVEHDTPGQPSVEVSWQTGGMTFDFDGLLAASLARLEAS